MSDFVKCKISKNDASKEMLKYISENYSNLKVSLVNDPIVRYNKELDTLETNGMNPSNTVLKEILTRKVYTLSELYFDEAKHIAFYKAEQSISDVPEMNYFLIRFCKLT